MSRKKSKPEKFVKQRHRVRTGDQLPENMRLAIFLSMSPTDLDGKLEKEANNHDTSSDELVEVKMESCTVWKSDSIKGNAKGRGKGRTDKECFRCGRIGHCRAKTHLNGGLPKSAPRAKVVGSCEEEEQETSKNVPLGDH